MAAAGRRSVALLLALPLGLGGCSLLLTRPPPERFVDPARPIAPIESCSNTVAPAVDTVLAVLLASAFVYGAANDKVSGGQAVLGATVVGTVAGSAIYGFRAGSACTRVEELNAGCMKGDRAACLALNPDFRPGATGAAPLLCAGDSGCGPGQRCVDSACVAAPPPATPGPAAEPPPPRREVP